MPAWFDHVAVGVIVGGAGLFVLRRAVQRMAAIVTRRQPRGTDAGGGCGCGSDCATAARGYVHPPS